VDTAQRIASLLAASAQGQAYFEKDGERTPLKGGDIAVLVSNHRQASEVAEQLVARGVPSVRRGNQSVWHSEEAAELAAVLAAYAEPGREGVLRYALSTRLLGRDALQLARCQDDERAWDREREDAELYHQLWQQQGFMRAFRAWLDQEQVAERLLAAPDGERRLTNLLHLAELLQAESQQRPGLEPLLAWLNGCRLSPSTPVRASNTRWCSARICGTAAYSGSIKTARPATTTTANRCWIWAAKTWRFTCSAPAKKCSPSTCAWPM
jgi:exodeoxyribonuclease V beta subunit